jgi:hypothetical protein
MSQLSRIEGGIPVSSTFEQLKYVSVSMFTCLIEQRWFPESFVKGIP